MWSKVRKDERVLKRNYYIISPRVIINAIIIITKIRCVYIYQEARWDLGLTTVFLQHVLKEKQKMWMWQASFSDFVLCVCVALFCWPDVTIPPPKTVCCFVSLTRGWGRLETRPPVALGSSPELSAFVPVFCPAGRAFTSTTLTFHHWCHVCQSVCIVPCLVPVGMHRTVTGVLWSTWYIKWKWGSQKVELETCNIGIFRF